MDIDQVTNDIEVTFSASTTRADEWMREYYGSPQVTHKFSDGNELPIQFTDAAKKAGLTIQHL